MAGSRTPGATGLDPDDALEDDTTPTDTHPIVGLHDEAQALDSTPKIIRVTRNWGDPPTPRVSNSPKIGGKTLKEALAELEKLDEWGTGGGNLSGPEGEIKLQPDDGGYTVDITGDFFITLPSWDGYADATPAQKAAWDSMITKLRKHEQQHVTIAYNGAQKLVRTLTNLPITQAAQKMQEVTDDTKAKQKDFDSAGKTNHGANAWGGFPKVQLDTSADPPPPSPKPASP